MKAILFRSAAIRFSFFTAVALLLSACTHTFTSANDVSKLPLSRGKNGGTFYAETNWKYLGTARGYDEFDYYYNIDNALCDRRVRIPSSLTRLHFPPFAFPQSTQWTVMHRKGDVLHFYAAKAETTR